jgi:hypothetical protein
VTIHDNLLQEYDVANRSNIMVLCFINNATTNLDFRSFDPFDYAPTFAEASEDKQDRLCSGRIPRE